MHFEEGLQQMVNVDIVICSMPRRTPSYQPDHVRRIMEKRKGRSLFLIDIALPRDVDPAVNDIDNVYLYNIDDLQQIVATNQAKRSEEATAAIGIVQQETSEFVRWLHAHHQGRRTGLKHAPSPIPSPRGEGTG